MKELEKFESLKHSAPSRDLFPEIEAKMAMLDQEQKQVSLFAGLAVAIVAVLFVLNVLEFAKPNKEQSAQVQHAQPSMMGGINQSYNLY